MQRIDKTLNKYKESHELNEDKLEYLRLFKKVQTQDQNQRAKHEISYYKALISHLITSLTFFFKGIFIKTTQKQQLYKTSSNSASESRS